MFSIWRLQRHIRKSKNNRNYFFKHVNNEKFAHSVSDMDRKVDSIYAWTVFGKVLLSKVLNGA